MSLVDKLITWSRGHVTEAAAREYVAKFLNNELGDGLIKSFLSQEALQECKVPTCTNMALDNYCPACASLAPESAATAVLVTMGEFLARRNTYNTVNNTP